MSFIARQTLRPISILKVYKPSSTATLSRPFHSTNTRAALNETDRDRDDVHKEIDHHTKDQAEKRKEGKGHWKGELASQSEAALKADREEIEASDDSISKLQKETEQYAQDKHDEAKK
ncbi:hypothetical protein MMC09_000697 [Bachmanniomyces sp. S44760]|nr:hypothetical protein [Bachmanniomyces sp. S44760]